MIYYIVPPIIIIASLSILIYYLFRKVSKVPSEELSFLREKSFFNWRRIKMIPPIIGSVLLKILEKVMHRSKLLSLKFHNISNNWFHSIKKKREKSKGNGLKKDSIKIPVKREEGRFKKMGIFRRNKAKSEINSVVSEAVETAEEGNNVGACPRPETVDVQKDKLEEALIRRIAVNPKDIEAYERLGDHYVKMGSGSDAVECYRQVIKMSPDHYKVKGKMSAVEKTLVE